MMQFRGVSEDAQNHVLNKSNGDVTFPTELLCLRLRVAPYQVSTLVALKVPWRNQHHVSFSYPYASLHLTPDTTQTLMSILTLN